MPLLCPSSLLQPRFDALNPSVEIDAVDQPRRVAGLCKPDDRDFSALAERAQHCRRDRQVLARWLQAQQPSRRIVVALLHCLPVISPHCFADTSSRSLAAIAFQSICRALAHWQGPMWPRGEPQVILRSFGSAFWHGVSACRCRFACVPVIIPSPFFCPRCPCLPEISRMRKQSAPRLVWNELRRHALAPFFFAASLVRLQPFFLRRGHSSRIFRA